MKPYKHVPSAMPLVTIMLAASLPAQAATFRG